MFLAALPPASSRELRAVVLYGPQARRHEPDLPFDLLLRVEHASRELKAGLSLASSAVQRERDRELRLEVVTEEEEKAPSPALQRLLQNARREGVGLWP